jgi:hypothetical protein
MMEESYLSAKNSFLTFMLLIVNYLSFIIQNIIYLYVRSIDGPYYTIKREIKFKQNV